MTALRSTFVPTARRAHKTPAAGRFAKSTHEALALFAILALLVAGIALRAYFFVPLP